MRAVVVLSGGLDSTTCMGIAQEQGYEVYPLTFDYGQRHRRELDLAKEVAAFYNVKKHPIIELPFLGAMGGSSLTDLSMDIPKDTVDGQVPSTYVPARNLIFLSLATAYAEVIEAQAIFVGVSAVDYSGYPDCRPEFIASFNQTVALGTNAEAIQVVAPLVHLSKADTVRKGLSLGVPYHLTTSCYQGEEAACGQCDSCRLRLQGFAENQVSDPIMYKESRVDGKI